MPLVPATPRVSPRICSFSADVEVPFKEFSRFLCDGNSILAVRYASVMPIEMNGGGREKRQMSYLRRLQGSHVLYSIALMPRGYELC